MKRITHVNQLKEGDVVILKSPFMYINKILLSTASILTYKNECFVDTNTNRWGHLLPSLCEMYLVQEEIPSLWSCF